MADQASPSTDLAEGTGDTLATAAPSAQDEGSPEGPPEATLETAATAAAESADEPVEAADTEAGLAAAATALTAASAELVDGPGDVAEGNPADLLGELARAMHATATSQYARMNAELERRRTDQVEAIASRARSESENLKAALEADVNAIDAWSKAETEKIKHERLRRIDARREQLAAQLDRQETIKEREVFAIEVAIDAHRKEIDLFFGRMERETDPAAIARVASTLPPLPPLDEIAETARRGAAAEFANLDAEAGPTPADEEAATATATGEPDPEASVSESRLMAVMDPAASRGGHDEAAQAWEAPYAVSVAAGTGAAEEHAEAEPEAHSRVGSTLLRTVRAIRPVHEERDTKR